MVKNVVHVDTLLTNQRRGKVMVVRGTRRLNKGPKLITACSMAVGHAHLVVVSGVFGVLVLTVVEEFLELRLILELHHLDITLIAIIVVRE